MKQFIYEFMNNSSTFVGTILTSLAIIAMIFCCIKINKYLKEEDE